jgi:general secretion pathway protein A
MEYYNILNFKKEPFSNSPEPEFLFQSPQHTGCLQKLELAIRLRRGLNVIIGDIGTGKTTLCRKLIQSFSSTPEDAETIEAHLIMDPTFYSPLDFLQNVASMFGVKGIDRSTGEWQLKEKIKDYLFNKCVTEEKIVVLFIDEGQKITENCLEILREFLNYETNYFKLLQIVIFAQEEFKVLLKKHANLTDRINLIYYLKPLNFSQTRAMIRHRFNVARKQESGPALFSFWGLLAIYLSTGGYPRKVVSLCHQVILMLIIRGKKKAGFLFVRKCLNDMMTPLFSKIKWAAVGMLVAVVIGFSTFGIILHNQNIEEPKQMIIPRQQLTPAAIATPVQSAPDSKITPVPLKDSATIQEVKKEDRTLPESIGTLTLRKGRTIWWTLKNVYSDSSAEMIQALIRANPRIGDINRLSYGKVLNLPSIPAAIKPLKNGDIILQIKKGKSLEDAYIFFRENPYRRTIPDTIFFSYWNKREGMTFSIVLDKCFRNNESAQEEINKLPTIFAAEAKILSHWDEDTIFFNMHSFNCSGVKSSGG